MTDLPLLICDLDGTLVEADGSISPRTQVAIDAIRGAGVEVAIATGRIPRGIEKLVARLALDGPQITMHGGLVIDVKTGEQTFSATLGADEVDELLALAAELDLPTLLCYPDGFRTNMLTQEVIDLFVPFNEPPPELVTDLRRLRASAPHKVAIWTGDDGYEAALAQARARLDGRYAITSGDNRSLELLPSRVNKARAAAALADSLGLTLDRVAAMGDGTNDIEMLSAMGRSVAMRHARPEVRAAATSTIPDDLPDDAASAIGILYPDLVSAALLDGTSAAQAAGR
jgi:Cof subfamily protein (haloacid dehalogenase superfamily)